MNTNRKVILYIAASLDGYIARPNGDIDWLSIVQKQGEDYGYSTFLKTVDTVILGRRTYDKVLSMVNHFSDEGKDWYVITREERPPEGKIKFYNGKIQDLMAELHSHEGSNIFIDGGAELINELMKNDQIDEFIISIIPIFLGNGIRLFKDYRPEMKLKLVSGKTYDSGLVQIHYIRSRE
jgi:dihydrofolate reductase